MQRRLATRKMSVCLYLRPSVRPTDKRVDCDKMIESSAQIFIPYESFILVLPKRRMASGGRPLLPEILDQTGPGSENADFQSIFARSASAVTE